MGQGYSNLYDILPIINIYRIHAFPWAGKYFPNFGDFDNIVTFAGDDGADYLNG
jgi:hypothetical protein